MAILRRALAWDYGLLAVQSLGGMLGLVLFLLPDGRTVSPLQVAPWANEPGAEALPPILRAPRGEWPCVPFGSDVERDLAPGWWAVGESFAGAGTSHGYGSNAPWTFLNGPPDSLILECPYPADHPVRGLRRTIRPDPKAPAIDLTREITVRRPCRLPIGLHPTFRLSNPAGSVVLKPGPFRAIHTFPGALEPGAARFVANATFPALQAAPARGGGTLDVSALPLAQPGEDRLQIIGATGRFGLHYRDVGFRACLIWDADRFPSVILWISNRGRMHWPWGGRHLALDVEPVASAFDLGPGLAAGRHPFARDGVATAIQLSPETPFHTTYRLAAEPAGEQPASVARSALYRRHGGGPCQACRGGAIPFSPWLPTGKDVRRMGSCSMWVPALRRCRPSLSRISATKANTPQVVRMAEAVAGLEVPDGPRLSGRPTEEAWARRR